MSKDDMLGRPRKEEGEGEEEDCSTDFGPLSFSSPPPPFPQQCLKICRILQQRTGTKSEAGMGWEEE